MSRTWLGPWMVLLAACRPGADLVLDPPTGNLAGYHPVQADLTATDVLGSDVIDVRIGGIRAYGLTADGDDTLEFVVQGAPSAGPQTVELVLSTGETASFDEAFTYDAPVDPLFARMTAMGASFSQGVQGGVPIAHGVLHSPPHLVAQQGGAYLPQPMLIDPLFPTIGWADIGPAPECEVPNVVSFIAQAAIEVLPRLEDDELDTLSFAKARVDPYLEIHNVGVGDTDLSALVNGPPDDPAELFVVKMVYAPDATVVEKITTSQIELIEALEPTLVMVADTYGNDLIGSVLIGDELDPSRITDEETFTADLEDLAARLSATGAEVFLANIPRPTILPATRDRKLTAMDEARASAEATGEDPEQAAAEAEAEIDALIDEIDAIGGRFNTILDEVVGRYDNVHVVDFAGMAEDIEATPLQIGGRPVDVQKFGGLLSTDGVHFGDVGYGVLANLFLRTIGDTLGVETTPVDLEALYEADPYSPDAALAAGVDPAACR